MHAKTYYAAVLAVTTAMLSSPAAAEIKKVAYSPVKVEIARAYKPDAAFEKMHNVFVEATRKKDSNALFALVSPGFVWNSGGALSNDADLGRSPLHNFKVLFGFRAFGKDSDGGVNGGPSWDVLSDFAADDSYYKVDQGPGLVCSPMAATVEDDDKLDQARKKIETGDDVAEWYFVLRETRVMRSPDDKGLPVATVSGQAFPVLDTAPAAREGQPEPEPTHYEVLLPTGKTGWIQAAAARPLESSRLCYALTAKGDWAIAFYDGVNDNENEEDDEDENGK